MYLRDLLLGLRRRWYVVLIGLLVTAGLAVGVSTVVTAQYTTTTSLLLLPPKAGLGTNGNPYLSLGGLGQALEVLSTRVNASDDNQALLKRHPEATVSVGADTTSTGPIVLVSATAPSAAEATQLRDQVTQEIPSVLQEMQTSLDVRGNSQITLTTLASDQQPEKSLKNLIRAVIVVLALGATLTFLATGYLDSVLVRRRNRRFGSEATAGRDRPRPNGKPNRKQAEPKVSGPDHGWDLDLEDEPSGVPPRILTGADSGSGRD